MSTGSFPGVKRPGRGIDHPPPSSAEVKERVGLYLYSPSRPSWPVLGWTLYTFDSTCDMVNIEHQSPFEWHKFSYSSFSAIFETLSYCLLNFVHVRDSLQLITEDPHLVKLVRSKKLKPGTKILKNKTKILIYSSEISKYCTPNPPDIMDKAAH